MSLLMNTEAIMLPAGAGDLAEALDIRSIIKAESRLVELQGVTKAKAGELLSAYIESWKDARLLRNKVALRVAKAKRHLETVRAMVVIDRGPELLKDKGLTSTRSPAGSADLRDATVALDPEFNSASEYLEQMVATQELLDIKAETFRMAYFSINKLIDPVDRSVNYSGGSVSGDVGELTEIERAQAFVSSKSAIKEENYQKGFGKPKI